MSQHITAMSQHITAIDVPDHEGTPTEGLIQYSYDANGNPTAKTDSSGPEPVELHFAYDSRDQLTQVIRGLPRRRRELWALRLQPRRATHPPP